jgi:hypothetical protein
MGRRKGDVMKKASAKLAIGHWVVVAWVDGPPQIALCLQQRDGLPQVWWPNGKGRFGPVEHLDSWSQIVQIGPDIIWTIPFKMREWVKKNSDLRIV